MYEYLINFTHHELPCQRIRSEREFEAGFLLSIHQTQATIIAKVGIVVKSYAPDFQDCEGILYVELLQYLVTPHENIGRFYLPQKTEMERKKFLN